MRRRALRKFLRTILTLLLTASIGVGGYYVYNNYIKPFSIPSVDKLVKEKKKNNFADKDDNKLELIPYDNPLPALREEYGNDEIMGKLQIPNLNIDALIFRAGDNSFYLNYNAHKEWDEIGVPFFDYRNQNLANDWQINIYGHNTKVVELYDQLPFTNLEAYMDKDIFDNYKDVYLNIDEKLLHYEVVAIKILPDASNNEHMKVVFSDWNDYQQHIQKLFSDTYYMSDNATFNYGERLLVMQICHYDPEGSYLLVLCKEKK